ncbi:MAG TPA: site-2 protease family protein [Candidatus Paceibacterota bacterium]|nr:site-2 protease family protein [Candidatus Paceibacterota bacterium]
MITFISIVILIFSVIIHEVSHGYMANYLGDPTARLQGRLTLNPLKHIDPIGSIVVPLITSISGFTFGWAKPVPYNPYNLKNRRIGELLIAMAGPASNISIALIFSLVIRYAVGHFAVTPGLNSFIEVTSYIVVINIVLAIFNLIPLPPLDGSKLLFSLLPNSLFRVRNILEAYAPIWVLIVVIFVWQFISPIVPYVFRVFTGL